MGRLDSCTRCLKFCKGHCTGQFVFRIFALSMLCLATILQGIAVSPKTKWDTFETVLATKTILHHTVEISAYQTLYDVAVLKDVADNDRSKIPSVYPIKKGQFNTEWKDSVSSYESTSQGLGIGAIVVLENALLIHFLIPESYFSRFFQPIALVITILMCAASGAFSILGALDYQNNHQQIFYIVSGPARIVSQYKQLVKYGFSYNFEDNVLSIGYYLAMSAGSLFCLCAALCVVNLVIYSFERYKIWKKAKKINGDEKAILGKNEKNAKVEIIDKKAPIKSNNDQIVLEDIEDGGIKSKVKKAGANVKNKDSKTEKTKTG